MSLANGLLALSVILSAAAAAVGDLAGYVIALAFLLACAGSLMGGRGFPALFAMLLAISLFFLEETGATALLKAIGANPTRFMRDWSAWLNILFALVLAVIFIAGLGRRGPTGSHAAVETADDIELVVNGIGRVAAFLFVPMMVIIFYDVSQRKILDFSREFVDSMFYFSSTKLQEMEWHLHAALFLFCLGFAYVQDAHVRIELVRDRLRPRARVWLELLGAMLFLFAYCVAIVKFGFSFTERAWSTGEISSAQTGLSHRWIIKALLPVGFIILGASGIAAALRCVVYLFGPEELRPRTDRYAGTHHADMPSDLRERGPVTD